MADYPKTPRKGRFGGSTHRELPTIPEGPEPAVCIPTILHTLADAVDDARLSNGMSEEDLPYAGGSSLKVSQAIPILIACIETLYHHMMQLDHTLVCAMEGKGDGEKEFDISSSPPTEVHRSRGFIGEGDPADMMTQPYE